MPTSTNDELECPTCGNADLEWLGNALGLFRCTACHEHFEEEDMHHRGISAKNHSRRKMRHTRYSEDD